MVKETYGISLGFSSPQLFDQHSNGEYSRTYWQEEVLKRRPDSTKEHAWGTVVDLHSRGSEGAWPEDIEMIRSRSIGGLIVVCALSEYR